MVLQNFEMKNEKIREQFEALPLDSEGGWTGGLNLAWSNWGFWRGAAGGLGGAVGASRASSSSSWHGEPLWQDLGV